MFWIGFHVIVLLAASSGVFSQASDSPVNFANQSSAPDVRQIVATPVTQRFTVLFADIQPTDFDANAADLLAQYGITAGCGSNDFCPNANVTRAQRAIFRVRAIEGGDNFTFSATPYFTDVQTTRLRLQVDSEDEGTGDHGGMPSRLAAPPVCHCSCGHLRRFWCRSCVWGWPRV